MTTLPPAPPAQPGGTAPVAGAQPKKARRWPWIAGVAAALLVGVGIGGAGGSGGVSQEDYDALASEKGNLEQQLLGAESDIKEAEARADAAEESLAGQEEFLQTRSDQLDERSAELDEREAAVSATEAEYDANNLTPGVYIVGTDIEPGQYRTVEDVTGLCYFAQKDGDHILWNDVNDVGRPVATVQNAKGSTFEVSRECGTVSKIG